MSSINLADFTVLLRTAGFTRTDEQVAEMHVALGYLEQMIARVRNPRPLNSEPAHVFAVPDGD